MTATELTSESLHAAADVLAALAARQPTWMVQLFNESELRNHAYALDAETRLRTERDALVEEFAKALRESRSPSPGTQWSAVASDVRDRYRRQARALIDAGWGRTA